MSPSPRARHRWGAGAGHAAGPIPPPTVTVALGVSAGAGEHPTLAGDRSRLGAGRLYRRRSPGNALRPAGSPTPDLSPRHPRTFARPADQTAPYDRVGILHAGGQRRDRQNEACHGQHAHHRSDEERVARCKLVRPAGEHDAQVSQAHPEGPVPGCGDQRRQYEARHRDGGDKCG